MVTAEPSAASFELAVVGIGVARLAVRTAAATAVAIGRITAAAESAWFVVAAVASAGPG